MTNAVAIINLVVGMLTLVTLVLGLLRMIQVTREAREARALAVAATSRAEEAARLAATHAAAASKDILAMGDNVQKIELATNSMKDALVAAIAKASDLEGEKRGLAQGLRESKEL